MEVQGLNHINVVASDLARTIAFYESVLGMTAQMIPNLPAGFEGRWLCDVNGEPIIHVVAHNSARHGDLAARDATTGSIDHVALACADFDGMLRRCKELGIAHRINDRQIGSLRQVFVTDPDNVVLELNFARD